MEKHYSAPVGRSAFTPIQNSCIFLFYQIFNSDFLMWRRLISKGGVVASGHEWRKTVALKRTINSDGVNKAPSLEELVAQLIANCSEALENRKLKVTVADLIRMREFRKELAPIEIERPEVVWEDWWD